MSVKMYILFRIFSIQDWLNTEMQNPDTEGWMHLSKL